MFGRQAQESCEFEANLDCQQVKDSTELCNRTLCYWTVLGTSVGPGSPKELVQCQNAIKGVSAVEKQRKEMD